MATQRAPMRAGWTGTVRFFYRLPGLARLCWRLVRDRRVPLWTKAVLVAALGYVVLPLDLIPDALLVLGEVDDVVVLMAAARWFLRLCPSGVVQEHARSLGVRLP